jgi:RNA polymerase sigma-70 factor (ECF subfamily)
MMWWSKSLPLLALTAASVILLGVVALLPGAPAGVPVQAASPAARAEEKEAEDKALTVATLPPAVVKTTPQAGDTAVDAKEVTEIKVTFSKDMQDGTWSWSQLSEATFPKLAGKPKFEKDKRTCVLPVKLQPGKTYAIWVNSERFGNFKDATGQSAVPYLLVFQTKP